MKFVSYIYHGKSSYGLVNNDQILDLGERIGTLYPDLKSFLHCHDMEQILKPYINDEYTININEITYLPVIPNPSKIICAGMNFKDKKKEYNVSTNYLITFIRFNDTQTGHNQILLKPRLSQQFDYEGELAVIIGKEGYQIKHKNAMDYIAGYSCYMDASVRDWQHTCFTAGKNWLKTGGFGPYLITKDEITDIEKLSISTYVNGKQLQNDLINNMIFSIPQIIEYISTFTKLSVGDVIVTGSPGGSGKHRSPPIFLKEGDIVEVDIPNIGKLKNFVIEQQ